MRFLLSACLLMAIASPAVAQIPCSGNECTIFILHAVDTGFGACDEPAFSCQTGGPTTEATGMATPAVFLIACGYEELYGVQVAFDMAADWPFTFGLWNCQANQLSAKEPAPPWGATDGTITTAFDGITGGWMAVIGRLHFGGAGSGCIQLVESSFPFGTHVVDGTQNATGVSDLQRGSVCNGTIGADPCGLAFTPCDVRAVEAATWGRVKAMYRLGGAAGATP